MMVGDQNQSPLPIIKKVSERKKSGKGKKKSVPGGQIKPEENKSTYKKEMVDVFDIEDCLVKTNKEKK